MNKKRVPITRKKTLNVNFANFFSHGNTPRLSRRKKKREARRRLPRDGESEMVRNSLGSPKGWDKRGRKLFCS